MKKITQGMKIIPVVIDACEIPESLKSTLWQRIDDLTAYDAAFQRILAAIFDTSEKPQLGRRPERFAASEPRIPTLTQTDERIFREIGRHEIGMEAGVVSTAQLRASPALAGISDEELRESLEVLTHKELIAVDAATSHIAFLRLTIVGFRQYAEAYIEDYRDLTARIAALLVNEDAFENRDIAARAGTSLTLANFILDVLADAKQIVLSKYGSGLWEVVKVAPSLKRSIAS